MTEDPNAFRFIEQGKVFGEWDAPMTDDHERIDAPTDRTCIWCNEQIKEGDNGHIAPVWGAGHGGHVEHRECCLRSTLGGIGHLVDHPRFCRAEEGPDAGLTRRQSSLMAWEFFQRYMTRGATSVNLTDEEREEWLARIEQASCAKQVAE